MSWDDLFAPFGAGRVLFAVPEEPALERELRADEAPAHVIPLLPLALLALLNARPRRRAPRMPRAQRSRVPRLRACKPVPPPAPPRACKPAPLNLRRQGVLLDAYDAAWLLGLRVEREAWCQRFDRCERSWERFKAALRREGVPHELEGSERGLVVVFPPQVGAWLCSELDAMAASPAARGAAAA